MRDETGWFVPATVIEVTNPLGRLMTEEIFGPVLTVYVYAGNAFDQTLALVVGTSPFALTGTVVGQQPFGGTRASGTNDKAGNIFNLIRWTSVRSIKEAFLPAQTWGYPHQRVPVYRQPENLG